jgi:dTDP-4-dehydrorhamnose 3,5-epimerase
VFTPARFGDDRGWFSESYNARREQNIGITDIFVQDNQSLSTKRGTVRGIHFQLPPHGQAKLVRCTKGALIDYVVDLRNGSPTYGKHVAAELSAETGRQIYIPIGFGHAFVTLEDDTEISYKVTDYYDGALDAGVRWNSPGIEIDWPVKSDDAILSQKDKDLPLLSDFQSPFEYDGTPLQLKVID